MTSNKKPFPFMIRLMLVAVFCILAMPAWAFWYFTSAEIPDINGVQVFGIPFGTFVFGMCAVLPVLLLLFVFLTGAWRLTLALIGSILLGCFIIGDISSIPEKNRRISFSSNSSFPTGTEVFCNGISLGKIPFDIFITDLMKKVPCWETPPEQHWYFDDKNPIYTWLPWDNFIKERYAERFVLDPAKGFTEFDSRSQFWWRFEFNGTTAIIFNNGDDLKGSDFSKRISFSPSSASVYYPALQTHFDLVIKILKDDNYKPSPEWIAHVVKYSKQLLPFFYRGKVSHLMENGTLTDERLEPVLDALARYRYGLSETPTPEECERAIDQILSENRKQRCFFPINQRKNYYINNNSLGQSYDCEPLIERAIRQMGTASEESLRKKIPTLFYTNLRNSSDDSTALIYMIGANGSPNLFDAMTEIYATKKAGFREIMSFRDARTIPLLKTLLMQFNNPMTEPLFVVYYYKIPNLLLVDNPMLEPTIRDYLFEWLPKISDKEYYDVSQFLNTFVMERLKFDWIDRNELAHWVELLQIPGRLKTIPLQLIQDSKEKPSWFRIAQYRTKTGEEFSIEMLQNWLRNNPDKPIDELIYTLQDNAGQRFFPEAKFNFLNDLLNEDCPEAEDLAKRLWKDPEDREIVINIAKNDSGQLLNFFSMEGNGQNFPSPSNDPNIQKTESDDNRMTHIQFFQLPGTYNTVTRLNRQYFFAPEPYRQTKRQSLPNFYASVFSELTESKDCIIPAILLQFSENPEMIPLLERWSRSENIQLKYAAEKSLTDLKLRVYLNENRRQLFNDLVSGKIMPDEILPTPKPFVWNGKQYVEK